MAAEDSENFWRVPASQTEFWDAYVSTRPRYSSAFYNVIYDHHTKYSSSRASGSSSSSKWECALDVGCGAGQVTAELTGRFHHVIASDNNDSHLDVARSRLSAYGSDQISYTLCKGEDLLEHHQPGSVDLIVCAEAITLMDEAQAMHAFSTLLRPGGTLATWFYGRPTFAELEYFDSCQAIVDDIMVRNWHSVFQGSKEPMGKKKKFGLKRCADGMGSWLDSVKYDPQLWSNVHRRKWNTHATLPFFDERATGLPVDIVRNVTAEETSEEIADPDFWKNEWDIVELKKYFGVLFPGFKEAVGDGNPQINALFEELKVKMGGEGCKRKFTWPAVLVLSTRKLETIAI